MLLPSVKDILGLFLLSFISLIITYVIPIGLIHSSIPLNYNRITFVLSINVFYIFGRIFFDLLFVLADIVTRSQKKYNLYFHLMLIVIVTSIYYYNPTINVILLDSISNNYQNVPELLYSKLKYEMFELFHFGYNIFTLLLGIVALLTAIQFVFALPMEVINIVKQDINI